MTLATHFNIELHQVYVETGFLQMNIFMNKFIRHSFRGHNAKGKNANRKSSAALNKLLENGS